MSLPTHLLTGIVFFAAALAEIAGCYAFWAWLRHGQSWLWAVAGLASLAVFAYLLTLAPSELAGRAYAAYGGIYIASALLWMALVEGSRPDRWDVVGGALAIVAASVIIFAPRS